MSAITQPQARAIASAFTAGNPMRPRKLSADDLCNHIRNLALLNHGELTQVLFVLADYVNKAQLGLNEPCREYVVSHLDDICGRIENDLAQQQEETKYERELCRREYNEER